MGYGKKIFSAIHQPAVPYEQQQGNQLDLQPLFIEYALAVHKIIHEIFGCLFRKDSA